VRALKKSTDQALARLTLWSSSISLQCIKKCQLLNNQHMPTLLASRMIENKKALRDGFESDIKIKLNRAT